MQPAGNTAVLELHLFPPKYSPDKDIDRFKLSQIFALGELLSYIQRAHGEASVHFARATSRIW